jgi:hypothetical protein
MTVWPLDQSQRSLSDGDIVPLTARAICSTVELVLLSDEGIQPRWLLSPGGVNF